MHFPQKGKTTFLFYTVNQDVAGRPERSVPQLLCDVVITVRVFEGKVELVISFQHFLAFSFSGSWTKWFTTVTIYVNLSTPAIANVAFE